MKQSGTADSFRPALAAFGCAIAWWAAGYLSVLILGAPEAGGTPIAGQLGGLCAAMVVFELAVPAPDRKAMPVLPGLKKPEKGWLWRAAACLCVIAIAGCFMGGAAAPAVRSVTVADFIRLCLLPALAEEMVFRGMIENLLRPLRQAAAILATAILFAAMHSTGTMLYALVAGLALGWCALRCGSIWPGVAVHFINNTLAFCGLISGRVR